MSLDTTDRWLVQLLQEDADQSYASLGKTVGLSISAVNERVRKLKERGVIRRYTVLVAPEALDLAVLAFVQVTLERPKHRDPFTAEILKMPEVMEAHALTGAADFLLKVRCHSMAELETLTVKKLSGLKGVARIETQITLSSLKETPALNTRAEKPVKAK